MEARGSHRKQHPGCKKLGQKAVNDHFIGHKDNWEPNQPTQHSVSRKSKYRILIVNKYGPQKRLIRKKHEREIPC